MSHPKVVAFDLGKVLVDFDYSIAARRITARCARAIDYADFFSHHASLLGRYELGEVTTQEFFDAICDATSFSGTRTEFGDYFADIFTEIPPIVRLHATLRGKGLRTYIFSNTNELAISHIRRRFPFFSTFDGYIFSYEEGAMKPDRKIYEALEKLAGCSGPEICYMDDLPQNIAAGAARGWQTVLHESPEKTQAALAKLGLL